MKIEIENMIGIHTEKWSLCVGTSADNPNYIELRTHDQRSIDWFGKVAIAFTKDEAKAVGEALIRCSEATK